MIIYHNHHIIPKHAGGTDDPSNIVRLTVKEHAEEHRKLYEENGAWQDFVAWKTLSGQISKAEAIKLAQSKANKGKKISDEHKRLNSIATKQQWFEGRAVLDQDKVKVSMLQKYGVENIRKLVVTCPHCNKSGQYTAFKRWHFDRCKKIN
jgi:hypothetical protein